MGFHCTTYMDRVVDISTRENETGAWEYTLEVRHGEEKVARPDADPTQAWLTEAEAVRAGVDQARLLVDSEPGGAFDRRNPARRT